MKDLKLFAIAFVACVGLTIILIGTGVTSSSDQPRSLRLELSAIRSELNDIKANQGEHRMKKTFAEKT